MFNLKHLILVTLLGISPLAQAATGELWAIKMTGMGMDMPATEVCMAKDKLTEKDVQQDKDCHSTGYKNLGPNRAKFSYKCNNGDTGDGDVTRDSKSYKSIMNMVSKGEKMTMTSEGVNTGKACDPDAGKKEMEAAMAKSCEDQSKKMDSYISFFPSGGEGHCGKYKSAYCSTVKTTASKMDGNAKAFKDNAFAHGLGAEYTDASGSWQKAVKACGAGNPDSIAKNAYDDAIKTTNWEAARYINKSEVDAIYARECVGRNYTSKKIREGYHNLCNGVSESASESNGNNENTGSSSDSAGGGILNKAKKLKGLFGL